jgi:hypothetical protein
MVLLFSSEVMKKKKAANDTNQRLQIVNRVDDLTLINFI